MEISKVERMRQNIHYIVDDVDDKILVDGIICDVMDKMWKGDGCAVEVRQEMSAQRMADLERRVLALEERTREALWNTSMQEKERSEALTARYGEAVDKTVAAKILGVTRATVYTMLSDGRIESACAGRRVSVRSIASYLSRRTGGERRRRAYSKTEVN